MTDRVDLGDEPAVRGAQHVEAVDAERAANGVDVVRDCRRAVVGDRAAQLRAAGCDGSEHRAHAVLKRLTVDRARSARAARVHEQQIAGIEQWAELVEVAVPLARRRDPGPPAIARIVPCEATLASPCGISVNPIAVVPASGLARSSGTSIEPHIPGESVHG